MSSWRFPVAVLLPMAFCLACAAPLLIGQDDRADFSRYRSFAFAPPSAGSGAPGGAEIDQAVRSAVTEELAPKGLAPAQASPADLLVSYSAISNDGVTYGGVARPWAFGNLEEDPSTSEGSLTLQLVDSQRNRVVWEGVAKRVIGTAGASQPRIHDAVKALLMRYPGKR